ncbi:MAG TPA: hypothetical protein VM912_09245 [Terriglobales bacterium]|nr:hypothetical protein [Terriglobales bacterium]
MSEFRRMLRVIQPFKGLFHHGGTEERFLSVFGFEPFAQHSRRDDEAYDTGNYDASKQDKVDTIVA